VVGGGLSGLSAAWLLGRGHDVTLYERQARPGFTAASVTAPGSSERIDVPLRVFYPGYYPTLTRLYQALGVASEPVSYAASFSGADGRLYFRYRNLRWHDQSLGWLAPQDLLRGPAARQILRGLLRFQRQAVRALQRGALTGHTVGTLVQGYPPAFVDGFLLPAICTVCTCTADAARDFPAEVIVDYLARGLLRQSVRRALAGADDVEQRLRQGIPALHCAAPVRAVQQQAQGVALHLADGTQALFDHVVIATQANQARALLTDEQGAEAPVLVAFRYQPVTVLTHTDAALMPSRRCDWSPVNLRVLPGGAAPESTIWVNAVQPALRGVADVFQTVHPQRRPRAGTLIGEAGFERPVVDNSSRAALQQLQALHAQPGRRLWFCGSYAQAGIPLLESAVRSAHDVAQRFDQGLGQGLRADHSA
jgi:predicted NAD/FAD-binding protein